MKVAVLLFGQPRFLNITKDLIKQEFTFPGHDVDYFAHFWNNIGYVPHGEEHTSEKNELHDQVSNTFTDLKYLTIDNYDELDNVCENISFLCTKLIDRALPIGRNIPSLYYKFGQHWSMKKCFKAIEDYEQQNNIKYDLIIKARTDVIYRIPECYESEKEYFDYKEKYYFDIKTKKPTIKAVALRFLDLTSKINGESSEGLNLEVSKFYNNKYELQVDKIKDLVKYMGNEISIDLNHIKDKKVWLKYNEDYNIRLAFNDWSLVANREGADIMFKNWFENYFLTLAKDIKYNDANYRNFFISQSDHCIQGQFLLNYNIQANRVYERRDVRLLNRVEIKKDVDADGKILVTPNKTELNFLKYSLIKRWSLDSIDSKARLKNATNFAEKFPFKK